MLKTNQTGRRSKPENAICFDQHRVIDLTVGLTVRKHLPAIVFTDAMGNYSVVVPTGIFDVEFRTRKASIVRDIVSMSVAVTGPTTLDASLSLLPMLVYADDPAFPGPQVVLPGSPQIFATIAIYNPNGITTGAFLDAEIEEPFGTDVNDLPLHTLSRMIEINLRERLGETDLPEPVAPVDGILS